MFPSSNSMKWTCPMFPDLYILYGSSQYMHGTWFFFRTCQNIVTWCNLIIKCPGPIPWHPIFIWMAPAAAIGTQLKSIRFTERTVSDCCVQTVNICLVILIYLPLHDNRSKKLCSKARTTSKYCLIDLFDSTTNSFFSLSAPLSAVSSLPHFFTHFPNPLGRFTHWVPLDLSLPCAMRPCHAMPPCHAAAIRLSRDVDADNLAIQLAVVKGRHSFLSILWPAGTAGISSRNRAATGFPGFQSSVNLFQF